MNEPEDQESSDRESSDPENSDQETLELLDDYLAQLQAGVAPGREKVLCEHPELASALDCLEALEGLAPRSTADERDDHGDTMMPPAMGNLPREFGPYELLSEIGRGGMGVVYKARQIGLDRIVAVKMVLGAHLASPEHVRRFQAEARAAARVRHPNIVPIHEVGQLHGQDYFAMELIEGESLAERIARGPLGVESAVRMLIAVARAVDHLHEQEIVHRDLKPSNILLDGEELPYVTDFGLAKVFAGDSQMTATGVIAGTPSYMAPEQAAGKRGKVGPAVDVYSLGAILYELLAGRPPFRGDTPLDTLLEVLDREPMLPRQLNPHVPRELELICLKCLAKSPDDRYVSAGALADDLEHFARGEALEVRPPHVGQRLWRWTRRQPALASRLGAFSVFYAIEMVNFRWRTGDVDEAFHWKVSVLLAAWALASVACQQFVDNIRWSIYVRFAWGALDSLMLLAVLFAADGAASPLVVGYPLLIVCSGLWFRVRFVSYMTALSLLSYGILVVDFYCWRPELQIQFDSNFDRPIINALTLVLVGASIAYLVHRVRTLSSFYGRRLP